MKQHARQSLITLRCYSVFRKTNQCKFVAKLLKKNKIKSIYFITYRNFPFLLDSCFQTSYKKQVDKKLHKLKDTRVYHGKFIVIWTVLN